MSKRLVLDLVKKKSGEYSLEVNYQLENHEYYSCTVACSEKVAAALHEIGCRAFIRKERRRS